MVRPVFILGVLGSLIVTAVLLGRHDAAIEAAPRVESPGLHAGGVGEDIPTTRVDPAPNTVPNENGPRKVSKKTQEVLARFYESSPDAEDLFRDQIQELRLDPAASVARLVADYRALPEHGFGERYAVVSLLAFMEAPQASVFLREIATLPVPEESSTDPHHFNDPKEIAIRGIALEGLSALASAGDRAAFDVLMRAKGGSDPTLSKIAAQAALRVNEREGE